MWRKNDFQEIYLGNQNSGWPWWETTELVFDNTGMARLHLDTHPLRPDWVYLKLEGTFNSPGNYKVIVRWHTNNGKHTHDMVYNIDVVEKFTVRTDQFSDATADEVYTSPDIIAISGVEPYSWSMRGQPAGLTLAQSAANVVKLHGVPHRAGRYNVVIEAEDQEGFLAQATSPLHVADTTIQFYPDQLYSGRAGQKYDETIDIIGGATSTTNYCYELILGKLPAGLELRGQGPKQAAITGVPNETGKFRFIIKATLNNESGTRTISKEYDLEIAPSIEIKPEKFENGKVGVLYEKVKLEAYGGTGPYSFSVNGGRLPDGMELTEGEISGTPKSSGNHLLTIKATDQFDYKVEAKYNIFIDPPTIVIQPDSIASGKVGDDYGPVTLSASGGVGPYKFSMKSGVLPDGMAIIDNHLTGTPRKAGVFEFSLSVTDSSGHEEFKHYSLSIVAKISVGPSLLPSGQLNVPYDRIQIEANGGVAPYTFKTFEDGTLPEGLTLDPKTGVLSGTPTRKKNYFFWIGATDANGVGGEPTGTNGWREYHVRIGAEPHISIMPLKLLDGKVNEVYPVQTFRASGGEGEYSYKVYDVGALPPGLKFNAGSAQITGKPTHAGKYRFWIGATDSNNIGGQPDRDNGWREYTLEISAPTITLSPGLLPVGKQGTYYSQIFEADGGVEPYTYTLKPESGDLPDTLNLDSSGFLSGTLQVSGEFPFTVIAVDDSGHIGEQLYKLKIEPMDDLSILPTAIQEGKQGLEYSIQFAVNGGTSPFEFQLVSGRVPKGLNFTLDGLLSGWPSEFGDFNFTLRVKDHAGRLGYRSYKLTVRAAPTLSLKPDALEDAYVDVPYSQIFTTEGGTPSYTYEQVSGELPENFSFSALGVLTGTAASTGTFDFSIRATDQSGYNISKKYQLTIR